MDDVIEAAGHRPRLLQRRENAVGRSIVVLILAMIGPSFSLSSRAL